MIKEENIKKANVEIRENFILKSKIEDCNFNSLFSILQGYFIGVFNDIQELRKFVSFLKENKKEVIINDLIKNFKKFYSEFTHSFKG